jgi:hypothetical protein
MGVQVRPVTDEKALNRLAELPMSEVRPEFRAQVWLRGACLSVCLPVVQGV